MSVCLSVLWGIRNYECGWADGMQGCRSILFFPQAIVAVYMNG